MRKLTKQVLMLALAGLVAGFTACKEQPQNKKNNSNHEVLSEDMQGLTFTIALPGEAAVEVDTRAIHVVDEWAIDQLWVYEFDRDGAKLLKDPVNVKNQLTYVGTEAKFTYTINNLTDSNDPYKGGSFTLPRNKTYKLEFIANADQNLLNKVTEGLAYTAYKELVVEKTLPKYNEVGFVMTNAEAVTVTVPASGDVTTTPQAIKMQRLAARIDVYALVPKLDLKKITLKKQAKQSYLTSKNPLQVPASQLAEVVFTPTTAWFTASEAVAGIYTYEQPATDNLTLSVEATYNGHDLKLEVPFLSKTKQAIAIERNHLYRVLIREEKGIVPGTIPGEPGQFRFGIEVLDWNEGTDFVFSKEELDNLGTNIGIGVTINPWDNVSIPIVF